MTIAAKRQRLAAFMHQPTTLLHAVERLLVLGILATIGMAIGRLIDSPFTIGGIVGYAWGALSVWADYQPKTNT